jgi:hypothetical protein
MFSRLYFTSVEYKAARDLSFCQKKLARNQIEMWASFACPQCHKLLCIRRNFTIRILRLALNTGILINLLAVISDWLRLHIRVTVFLSAATIGLVDEYVMRLLPAKIDPPFAAVSLRPRSGVGAAVDGEVGAGDI